MAKRTRRRRVPEVLWRLFHNKARTLADTILSLLPFPQPSVADCRCKGRRCLGCSGEKAMRCLLRPKDPSDYRKLLNQCFVVVPDRAPPFFDFDPHNRWSQLEAVRRNIEMIMCEPPTSSNVICSGYNKSSRFSSIVEHLTSSAWCLLLKRVGDILMVYLLRNTLIFLPLPQRKHHQVAGFPISDLCTAFSKHPSSSKYQYGSDILYGSGKKRKRVDGDDPTIEKRQSTSFSDVDISSTFTGCIGCSGRTDSTPSGRCCEWKFSGKSVSRDTAKAAGAKYLSTEVCSSGESKESSTQAFMLSKKRVRKYSWQRHKKRRHLSCQATSSLIPGDRSLGDKDGLSGELCCSFNTNKGLYSEKTRCSCCLVFQTLPKVIRKAEIDRQRIFYKLESSSSVFPRERIHL